MNATRHDLNLTRINAALLRGDSYATIAQNEGKLTGLRVSRNTIAGIARDIKRGSLIPFGGSHERETYVYGYGDPQPGKIPVFAGELELFGDYLIINDVHLPYTSKDMLHRVQAVAQNFSLDNVVIAGDLFDFASISKYANRERPASLNEELIAGEQFFCWLLDRFNHVVYLPGNHEERLLKELENYFPLFVRQLTRDDRVVATPYDRVFITSGNTRWMVCHQHNASSSNKLAVAEKLAWHYQCNVVTTHQHKNALALDRYANHVLASVGGLHEPLQAAYVQLKTSTAPVQEQGFATLIDGHIRLWTPDRRVTQWAGIYGD